MGKKGSTVTRRAFGEPRKPAEVGRALLTPQEAADYCGVSERWIRRAIAERRIPKVKMGGLVRLRKEDLDAYIAAQTSPAAEA